MEESEIKTIDEIREEPEKFIETVIDVCRVAKVVKGGKKLGFRALAVIGNGKGTIGVGIGKANLPQPAIAKAINNAKKDMITVPLKGTTIPYQIKTKFGAAEIILKPAPAGTGIVAGHAARAVLEACGIKDISAKLLRSSNPINTVYALIRGLKSIQEKQEIFESRRKG